MSHPIRAVVLASGALLLAAGCGSGGAGSSAPKATGADHVAETSLGKIIVDGSGHTLYMFSADHTGKSTCDSGCLQYWPPAKPTTHLSGVTGALGRSKTVTGVPILTVAGRPLYSYVGDHKAGDVAGEGLNINGGLWYAVGPDGAPVKASGGGGGY